MGKYSKYEKQKASRSAHKVHPIWAGIGFLMVIVVPVMTWAAAALIVELAQAQKWSVLRSFPTYLQVPNMLYVIPGIGMLTRIVNFPAIAVFFFFLLVIFSGLFSVLYALVYRIVGPPRYAPDDIPAPKIKTRPFKR